MEPSRYQQGRRLFSEIHGGLTTEKTVQDLQEFAPEMVSLTMEWVYGDLYSNQTIDMKTREISNISALVAIGALPQLRNHIYAAVKMGFSYEEIKHIILNVTIVVGFPLVINALMALKEVMEGDA